MRPVGEQPRHAELRREFLQLGLGAAADRPAKTWLCCASDLSCPKPARETRGTVKDKIEVAHG